MTIFVQESNGTEIRILWILLAIHVIK